MSYRILTLVLLLLACEPELLTTATVYVPDVDDWTCSIELVRDFASGDRDYTRDEPDIVWSYEADDEGDTRVRGFCQFPLESLTVTAERIRSCTLNYYITDLDAPAAVVIRHVAVDIMATAEPELYLAGGTGTVVAMDSAPVLGWRRLALNADGLALLKEQVRNRTGRISFCWDLATSAERNGAAAGHDDTLRPYLTIVHTAGR